METDADSTHRVIGPYIITHGELSEIFTGARNYNILTNNNLRCYNFIVILLHMLYLYNIKIPHMPCIYECFDPYSFEIIKKKEDNIFNLINGCVNNKLYTNNYLKKLCETFFSKVKPNVFEKKQMLVEKKYMKS